MKYSTFLHDPVEMRLKTSSRLVTQTKNETVANLVTLDPNPRDYNVLTRLYSACIE